MAKTLRDYPNVSIRIEDLDGKIDFPGVFGRKGPVHIEIGSGKGTYVVNESKAHPEVDFLGIEWANRYYRYAVDRIGRWGLYNVRLIRTDAADFIREYIPNSSVDCFHIYFPDPWPKKRHHKRRFINPQNVTELIRCLKKNGQIRIATDHEEYFEQISEVMQRFSGSIREIEFAITAGAEEGEWVGTNFERKYIRDRRKIFTFAAKKESPVL